MNDTSRDLQFEGFQLAHLFQGRRFRECGSPFLPQFNFERKKDKMYIANVEGAIQNDRNDPIFSFQQIVSSYVPNTVPEMGNI